MNRKQIEKLVCLSYTKGRLDEVKVQKISRILSKRLLKEYIKFLKRYEQKNKLIIVIYQSDPKEIIKIRKHYEKIFPKKNIVFQEDKTLIGGIKIIDNDKIYEFSLKGIFGELINNQTL